MRKFLRLITSRMVLTLLIILLEILLIILGVLYLAYYFWIAFFVLYALNIIVCVYIISTKGNVAYKVAWLFVVAIFPLAGAVLYLIFGDKKPSKRQIKKAININNSISEKFKNDKKEPQNADIKLNSHDIRLINYVEKESLVPAYSGNEVTYFPIGDLLWPVMLEELRKAKHYIFLEYFIVSYGAFWDSIYTILKEKALDGVDVRLIYDDFGSINYVKKDFPLEMMKNGIKCVSYNRFYPIIDVKMNNRDHRKIMVIDGHTAFTGGINLADEYVNVTERFGHWKDNAIMIKGKAAHGLGLVFLSMWNILNDDKEDLDIYRYEKYADELGYLPQGSGLVQPYVDIPFDDSSVGESVYINILNNAKDYVYIMTPYLIPSPELLYALKNAASQGVRVVLLTPHIPDKRIVFNVTRSYYRPLLEAGAEIYEYTPGFVHSKMFVSDDHIGTVGTINLDYRSLFLHLECGAILYSSDALKSMKKDFEDSIKVSELWTLEKYKKINVFRRMWWMILRIFAPFM